MKKTILIITTILITITITITSYIKKMNNEYEKIKICEKIDNKKFKKAIEDKDTQIVCTCGDYETFSINLLEICAERKKLLELLKN